MTSGPFISIIIPAWNSEKRIVMTLEAIARQSALREQFEVIVVDNGSTDGTADAARRFDFVKLLSEPVPGSYRARNRGLAAAQGEYVLFTDADCVPDPDWVEQAILAIRQMPDGGLYAGEIVLFREEGAGRFAASYEELFSFNQKGNVAYGICVTANWLCRRDDLRAIGGFNQDLLSGGDTDCSRRMIAAGHRLVHAPRMVVRHPTRASLKELIVKRRRVAGGRWKVDGMEKDGSASSLKQYAREAMNLARATKNSDRSTGAKVGIIGIVGILMLASQLEVLRLAAGRPPYRS